MACFRARRRGKHRRDRLPKPPHMTARSVRRADRRNGGRLPRRFATMTQLRNKSIPGRSTPGGRIKKAPGRGPARRRGMRECRKAAFTRSDAGGRDVVARRVGGEGDGSASRDRCCYACTMIKVREIGPRFPMIRSGRNTTISRRFPGFLGSPAPVGENTLPLNFGGGRTLPDARRPRPRSHAIRLKKHGGESGNLRFQFTPRAG